MRAPIDKLSDDRIVLADAKVRPLRISRVRRCDECLAPAAHDQVIFDELHGKLGEDDLQQFRAYVNEETRPLATGSTPRVTDMAEDESALANSDDLEDPLERGKVHDRKHPVSMAREVWERYTVLASLMVFQVRNATATAL
jgi:hypothetical protein